MSKRYSSGRKALRQNKTRRLRNMSEKSRLRTVSKSVLALVKAGKKDESKKAYDVMASTLDKAVKHGIMHKNSAARKKSRMAKKVAQLG